MSGHRQHGLPWAHSPFSELVRLAWPIAVSVLSYSVMTLVDTLFVGTIGPHALAGVGLAGTALWMLVCFPWGVMQGAKVLVSQAVGAGRRERVDALLGAALVFTLPLGGLAMVAAWLGCDLLSLLSGSAASGEAARQYFIVRTLGIPVMMLSIALREVRQGLGDSRRPMVASVLSNALNVLLDYLLIMRAGLGVAGAAWATVAAVVVDAGLLLFVQARDSFAVGRMRPRDLLDLWRMGWPTGLNFVVEMSCFAVLAGMIARYADVHMAAHQIALQVTHFSFLPALALGEAASVLTGQAVGAGRIELVRRSSRLALVAGLIYTGACGVCFGLGGRLIASAFTEQAELLELTRRLLLVAAAFQLLDGANIIGRGALRGTGDVRFSAAVGIASSWAFTPGAMVLLGYWLGLGVVGGWLGICIELLAGSLLFWWRLESGGWHRTAALARHGRQEKEASPTGADPDLQCPATQPRWQAGRTV